MISDTAHVRSSNVEQTDDGEKQRFLEMYTHASRALKGFITEYDQVKGERDHLRRQITSAHGEVETLRNQIEQLRGQRDQLSTMLSSLTGQLESFASRSLDVVRKARLQPYSGRTGTADATSRSSPPGGTGVRGDHVDDNPAAPE